MQAMKAKRALPGISAATLKTWQQSTLETFKQIQKSLKPPAQLYVDTWAEDRRYLSPESSAKPGKWSNENAPFLCGPMRAISTEPVVVLMCSSQVGKTEVLLNAVGAIIDVDPGPSLMMEPTLDMAEAISKDRIAPMLRDTPALKGKVKDARTRDSNNTLLHKSFPGGHLTLAGANSPASLASRPIRYLLADEVDRYPLSAGAEGDPLKLAIKRTTTFWNRRIVIVSTPTIKGVSRVEFEYMRGDQRRFFVPCASCGHCEPWDQWSLVKWDKGADGKHKPETAGIECSKCGHRHSEAERQRQVLAAEATGGGWRATAERTCEVVSFHFNQLISPWVKLADTVADFLDSKRSPETLRVWTNTTLGQTFEEAGERPDAALLYERREPYVFIPDEGLVLALGVDTQDNRLEYELVAYGEGHQSWGIEQGMFLGDPALPGVWEQLDAYIDKKFECEDGTFKGIDVTAIDSGGHKTQDVYRFCAPRYGKSVYATKGMRGPGRVIASRPSRNTVDRTPIILVGVDTAKERLLLSYLQLKEEGPGYCHFPESYPREYFDQLTAEECRTTFLQGFPVKKWVKVRPRNEKLDCRILTIVGVELLNPQYERLKLWRDNKRNTGNGANMQPVLRQGNHSDSSGGYMQVNPNWMNDRPF